MKRLDLVCEELWFEVGSKLKELEDEAGYEENMSPEIKLDLTPEYFLLRDAWERLDESRHLIRNALIPDNKELWPDDPNAPRRRAAVA